MIRRRAFLRNLVGFTVLGAGGTGAYANVLERHMVEIRRVPLNLGLGRPLRIAALGDIHFDPLFETDYLGEVMTLVAAQNPDLVCYLGDYVSRGTERFVEFADLTRIPRPTFGSFAILGNHDMWGHAGVITSLLENSGIRVLRNANIPLPGVGGWHLAGLDSFWAGRPLPKTALAAASDAKFILMVHEPDPFKTIGDTRVKLQLSGHTHGGQVRAPVFGALRLPRWGKDYDEGLFRDGDRHLYVNRGIGTVDLPLRFNCPPEITILELT